MRHSYLIAAFFLWGIFFSSGFAQKKIYWASLEPGAIQRANPDGSEAEVVLSHFRPEDIALDNASGMIYWTDETGGKVERAKQDGTERAVLLSGLTNPSQLALDLSRNKIYWTEYLGNQSYRIFRANMDGTEKEVIRTASNIRDFAVDSEHEKIYWASSDKIFRAGLDGSNVDLLHADQLGLWKIELDPESGKLYWLCIGDGIFRSNLDGTLMEQLVPGGEGDRFLFELDLALGKMYWNQHTFNHGNRLFSANLDGTGQEMLSFTLGAEHIRIAVNPQTGTFLWIGLSKIWRSDLSGNNMDNLVIGLGDPIGIALDTINGKMYWTESKLWHWQSPVGKIKRANLNGTDIEELVDSLSHPLQLALDLDRGKMYWTNHNWASAVYQANLDGSGVETFIPEQKDPIGLSLDQEAGMLYWTNNDPAVGHSAILRSSLDEVSEETLITRENWILGLALDPANDKIYWSEWASDLQLFEGYGHIFSANLDGSEIEELVFGLPWPAGFFLEGFINSGLALDTDEEKVYWTIYTNSYEDSRLMRANFDGSGVEEINTPFGSPSGVALAYDVAQNVRPSAFHPALVKGIFPNPAKGVITVLIKTNSGKRMECQVINALGSTIHREFRTGIGKVEFDCSGLPAGMYYFLLAVDGRAQAVSFVVE